VTEEQKRALEEAVKRAIEDWLKNKSTPRKLRGGLILSEGHPCEPSLALVPKRLPSLAAARLNLNA